MALLAREVRRQADEARVAKVRIGMLAVHFSSRQHLNQITSRHATSAAVECRERAIVSEFTTRRAWQSVLRAAMRRGFF